MKDCKNGCPPGMDMRTCMLAFMEGCPYLSSRGGDIFVKQNTQQL